MRLGSVQQEIVNRLQEGWKLTKRGDSVYMTAPQGFTVKVPKSTFESLREKGVLEAIDIQDTSSPNRPIRFGLSEAWK